MGTIRNAIEKNKMLVVVFALVVIAFVVYTNFFATEGDDSFISGEDKRVVNSDIGREIVNTLNELRVLDIDPDFFEQPAYTKLQDFTVEVQPRPVGKSNPFAASNSSEGEISTDQEGGFEGNIELEGQGQEEEPDLAP